MLSVNQCSSAEDSTASPEKEIMAVIGSGEDSLNADLFKTESQFGALVLQLLFLVIWEKRKLPDDWAGGCHRKVFEKRSPEQLDEE